MSPKQISKLSEKKHRIETRLFLVEGEKNITELLSSSLYIETLLVTKAFLAVIKPLIANYEEKSQLVRDHTVEIQVTNEETLVKTGTLLSNNAGIAVVRQKQEATVEMILKEAEKNIVIVLDDVRDPGNMGTIVRTADWYAVTHIVASQETVDFYNAKTISASMGSFTRVHVSYLPLPSFLLHAKEHSIPLIVADLHGEHAHTAKLPKNGLLLMGSESHGVSAVAQEYATHSVMIPKFGNAESLNVSVATGILLDTLRRNS